MPIYEYMCDNCGDRIEVIQKFSDAPLVTCASCGQDALSRVVFAPSLSFKGSGWYITDYSAKGRRENTSTDHEERASKATCGSDAAMDCDAGSCAQAA
ncbi:MAG: zinc ribbon domain-containing protein [Chloracidobacterium sp.]|nr:zinc ribbon domain-containing protein [Chloracidobacterium sp.]MDW8218452.1 FmdB family zinc ribbon protein [Acidobacteriota bacterium]